MQHKQEQPAVVCQRVLYACIAMLWMFLSLLPVVQALELTDHSRQTITSFADKNQILHDPDANLTPEMALIRITATRYQSDDDKLSLGQSWIYTPLLNRSEQLDWVVRSNNTLFEELDFYLHCQGQSLQVLPRPAIGFKSPQFLTAYFVPIVLPSHLSCGLLQRAKVSALSHLRAYLMTAPVAIEQAGLHTALSLTGVGITLGLIIYNFLLFFSIRSSTYLIYTLYACLHLSLILVVSIKPETLIDLFDDARHALRFLGISMMFFLFWFSLKFMQPGIQAARYDHSKPNLYRVLRVLVFLSLLAMLVMLLSALLTLFWPEFLFARTRVLSYIYIVSSVLIPLLALTVALSGYKPAWVFLPAWTILLISHAITLLDWLSYIDLYGWERILTMLAANLEMMILSIALGMSLRDSYRARDRAQLAREHAELLVEQQDRFISTLSHEIRTPLHAMLGATELLGRTELSTNQQELWSTTHYAAESMYALVDNLLDRAQFKQAKLLEKDEVFDPQRLLDALVQLLRPRATEKNLLIHLQTRDLPTHLLGKPVLLRRMLINLLSNAIKYTEVGEIQVWVKWQAAQQTLWVSVKDTGCGLSTEQLAHLETRFNRGIEVLYSQQASSGLGLPICFEMMRAVGGQLSLTSELGQGTEARFNLSMHLPNPNSIELKRGVVSKPLAILVVDDVASNRMLACETLKAAGHQVWQAADGREALALLQKQTFDRVLSDLRMPHLDGAQLLKHIRQQYPPSALSVILTSAHFTAEQSEPLLALDAKLLAKPYTPEALLAAIQGASQTVLPPPEAEETSLERIQARWGDEKTSILLALYQTQMDEDVQRIREGLSVHDESRIRVAAHRIVSASRALGLQANAEAALQIETHQEHQALIDWLTFGQMIEQQLGLIKV